MTDREVMQMALDALETVTAKMLDCRDELAEYGGRPKSTGSKQRLWDSSHDVYVDSAIPAAEALRERLAQGEQEPVAWCIVENGRVHGLVRFKPAVMNAEKWQPLYTAPPKRECKICGKVAKP